MALHLVTGYANAQHVTADDAGSLHAGVFGEGEYVLQRGSQFNAEIISNNKVRINDGDMLVQGRHIKLDVNTYEELDIENGTQSMYRNDLIVAQYSKDTTTGVETCTFEVVKGTPAESNPTDPEVTTGNILEGDTLHQSPLYRITINGLTLESITPIYTTKAPVDQQYTDADKAVVNPLAGYTDGAGYHNSVYRGKYLGTAVTTEQYAAILAGTFTDLFIGDYWTISGVNWRIASFDYWLRTGFTECTDHHVVIVPDTLLYVAVMNTSAVITGGYAGSAMFTTNLASAKTTINNAFSGHVLTHSELLTSAVNGSIPSTTAWYDTTVDLPNEPMMYGQYFYATMSNGSTVPTIGSISKTQLSLFAHNPSMLNIRVGYWLRDIAGSGYFTAVDGYGNSRILSAATSSGVRPVFAIKG